MKRLSKYAVLLMGAVFIQNGANAAVLDIFEPGNGSRYVLIAGSDDGLTGISWSGAEAEAVSLGGHLVTIDNQQEQDLIWSQWGQSSRSSSPDDHWVDLWIGLTDRDQEGTFKWISGTPVTYLNWGPGEPNNYFDEDYAFMAGSLLWGNTQYRGKWNDYTDSPTHGSGQLHYGVVEIASVPDAGSTFLLLGLTASAVVGYRKRILS